MDPGVPGTYLISHTSHLTRLHPELVVQTGLLPIGVHLKSMLHAGPALPPRTAPLLPDQKHIHYFLCVCLGQFRIGSGYAEICAGDPGYDRDKRSSVQLPSFIFSR
jgi:hypothetical protein